MDEKKIEKIVRRYLKPKQGFQNLHVQTVIFRLSRKPFGLIQSHFDITSKEAHGIMRAARKHIPREVIEGIRQKQAV